MTLIPVDDRGLRPEGFAPSWVLPIVIITDRGLAVVEAAEVKPRAGGGITVILGRIEQSLQ